MLIPLDNTQPACETQLAGFEVAFGHTLPPDYRAFQLQTGGGTPGVPAVLPGLDSALAELFAVSELRQNAGWQEEWPGLPATLLPIGEMDSGDLVALNFATQPPACGVYDHEAGCLAAEARFADFSAFCEALELRDAAWLVAWAQATLGVVPPASLLGAIGSRYVKGNWQGQEVSLYPAHDIPQVYEDYTVGRWMPGALPLGTDWGGRLFVADLREAQAPVYIASMGDLGWGEDEAQLTHPSTDAFIREAF